MKFLYVALLIALVTVVGVSISKKPEATETVKQEQAVQNEDTSSENTTPDAASMGMTAEEHAAMMGQSTNGTDVGMEMPETPMATSDSNGMMMDHSMMNQTSSSPSEKTFMVHGTDFAFDVTEIRVKKGDTVTIHFMSADGFHDLVINEFNARTEKIRTGGMAMVTFVADKAGTFEYYCSVGSHRMNGMVGKLIVE